MSKARVHTLGIDIGTSGVRAAAVDRNGEVVALEGTGLPSRPSPAPAVRQRPSDWAQAVEKVCRAVAGRCDLSRLAGLSIDGTSGTMLALDGDGQTIGDALMYNDASGAEHAARIAELGPPTSAAHGVTSALARAQWIWSARHPARLLHQADWIAGLFSGRFEVSDESNALKTGYDAIARRWPDWIDDISPALRRLLPEVVPSGEVIGRLVGPLSKTLGLPEDAVCIAGCTDGCAAVLATGAVEIGDAVTSLGSTLTLKLLSDKPVFEPKYGIYSHRLGDVWLPGGASNAGGSAIAEAMGLDAMKALDARIETLRDSGYDLYPSRVHGERFPVADPNHKPRMEPRPADDAVYLQALYEGLARVEAEGYARLSEVGAPKPRRIFAVGGGAASVALMAIRRRILSVDDGIVRSNEAAVGMARHAARHVENLDG